MDGAPPLPPRTRKPRSQGHARRGEILAAARRLFAEEGFGHATMRRIAAAVGVSPTALYVYFPDKEAILNAIAEDTFTQLLAFLEASQDPALEPLSRLRAGLLAYVRFGLSRPDEYRLTFSAPMPPTFGAENCQPGQIEAADLSFDVLERTVSELQSLGIFKPADASVRSEAIWAALHGITALLVDRPAAIENPPDLVVETLIETLIAGLLA